MPTPFLIGAMFMNEKSLALANACGRVNFELLISDAVRSMRGAWGEMIEITLPDGMMIAFVNEKNEGWVKIYKMQHGKYTNLSDILVNEENLDEVMKKTLELIGKR